VGGVFGGGQNLPGDFFRYISLAAIIAHFCGDSLEDKRGAFPLDCDARTARPGISDLADNALHGLLLL
jgi:hypothetical protein